MNLAKIRGFKIVSKDACGPYLQIDYKKNLFWFLNFVIELLVKLPLFGFLKTFGESQVLIFRK